MPKTPPTVFDLDRYLCRSLALCGEGLSSPHLFSDRRKSGASQEECVEIMRGRLSHLLNADTSELCQTCGDDGDPGGFVAVFTTAPGMGRKIWSIGFNEQAIVRDERDNGRQFAGVGIRHRTGKRDVKAQLKAPTRHPLIP